MQPLPCNSSFLHSCPLTSDLSKRNRAVFLADLDYADDICLMSNRVEQAQELLNRVEAEFTRVGPRSLDHLPLKTAGGNALAEASDFKYLGSWVNSTEQDLKVRKALAWRVLNGMKSVWKSSIPRHIKITSVLGASKAE